MKTINIIAALVVIALYGNGCAKNEFASLKYREIIAFDWLQVNVVNPSSDRVLWFQVFDWADDKVAIDAYRSTTEHVDRYPARSIENQDSVWVWVLINERIEIRLMADNSARDFRRVEKLKRFIRLFDLTGMAAVKGPKLSGKELRRFIPRIEEQGKKQ